jgi:CheY-like chemotaxis protein
MTNVLVVDDDQGVRRMMGLTLRSNGYEVSQAENGRDALDKMDSCEPDAIVLDLQMPVMTGSAFLREIRARGFDKPVVVVSGQRGADERHFDADAFLAKPFSPDRLVETVDRLVGHDANAGT